MSIHSHVIQQYTADFRQWIERYLCQRWLPSVWKPEIGLFAESLLQSPEYHRTMVVARQIFSLSKLLELFPNHPHVEQWREQLQHQAHHLQYSCYLTAEEKWAFSLTSTQQVGQTDQELYTYAFIIFAMTKLLHAHPHLLQQDILLRALEIVKQFFDPQTNEWYSKKNRHNIVLEGPMQNPLMHLFEAFAYLHQVAPEYLALSKLEGLWQYIHQTFYVTKVSAIAELPVYVSERDSWEFSYFERVASQHTEDAVASGNRIEPGHQFEWAFLLYNSALRSKISLENLRDGVLYHSDRISEYPLIPLSLELDYYTPIQDQSRIWAQCEWIRVLQCLSVHFPEDERIFSYLARALQALTQRFLHTNGWYEVLDYAGNPLRADQPTSTAYHLIGCYAALHSTI